MSREHARFFVPSASSELVHLRDVGSMHGTFVNDLQLPKDKSQALKNGDTIRFGSKVTRADETFYAREFRISYDRKASNPVSKPDHPTFSQPSLITEVSRQSPQIIQLRENSNDDVEQSVKGLLSTAGSLLGNYSVPDSDTDSYSSESVIDDSEPDQNNSDASLGTSAGFSSPQPCSEGVGDELVGIEIESRGAHYSVAISTSSDQDYSHQSRNPLDAKNETEAGSSQNPMVIDDDTRQGESDDQGPEVRYMGSKSVSAAEMSPRRHNNSPSEELSYKKDSKCQDFTDEIESCESVMGDISEVEASARSGLFAIYDNTSDEEDTDEEWEQIDKGARRDAMSRTLSEAYLRAKPAFAETDEGSDFSILDDDDVPGDESEAEPLSGDETELEPMSTDEYPQTRHQEVSATSEVTSLATTAAREPLTGQLKPDTVLVEDSQLEKHVPRVVLPSADSGNSEKDSSSGCSYVGEPPLNRAPSPSDAAMAKPAVSQATFPDSQTNCGLGDPAMLPMSEPHIDAINATQFSVPQHSPRSSDVRDTFTKNVAFAESTTSSQPIDNKSNLQRYPIPTLAAGTSHNGYLDGPFACSSSYTPTRSSTYGVNEFDFDTSSQHSTFTQANSFYPGNFQYISHASRAYNAMNADSCANSYWSPSTNGQYLGSSRTGSNVYPRLGQFGTRGFVPKRTLNQDSQQAYGHLSHTRPLVGMPKDPHLTKGPISMTEQSLQPNKTSRGQPLLTQWLKGKEVDEDATRVAPTASKGNPRGVSIHDIVEPSSLQETRLSVAGSKRKADEMSSTMTDEQLCDSAQQYPSTSTAEDTVLHDAQPRDLETRASQFSLPESSSAEVNLQTQPRSREVHISKKAKTETISRSGIVKYAATALASAVLGGVGVFATLIALPEAA
ncbi:MAG: hypothetical protein M1835_001843 [Candelina submexicana]|nr:MAG: hypothetical protein M1835_001843 [Candelina submexicana]